MEEHANYGSKGRSTKEDCNQVYGTSGGSIFKGTFLQISIHFFLNLEKVQSAHETEAQRDEELSYLRHNIQLLAQQLEKLEGTSIKPAAEVCTQL